MYWSLNGNLLNFGVLIKKVFYRFSWPFIPILWRIFFCNDFYFVWCFDYTHVKTIFFQRHSINLTCLPLYYVKVWNLNYNVLWGGGFTNRLRGEPCYFHSVSHTFQGQNIFIYSEQIALVRDNIMCFLLGQG